MDRPSLPLRRAAVGCASAATKHTTLRCTGTARRSAAQDKMTSRTDTDASASRWHACPRVVMPHGCTRAHSLKAALADLPPFSAPHWQLKVASKIIHLLRGPFSSKPTPRAAALVRDHLLRYHRSRGGVRRGEDAGTPVALVSTVCEQSEYRSSTDCGRRYNRGPPLCRGVPCQRTLISFACRLTTPLAP